MASYVEDTALELAQLAFAEARASGDEQIILAIDELVGASSQSLQESYATFVRVLRAEEGFVAKWQAFFHMTHYTIHPLMVWMALAAYNMGPARMIKLRSQAEKLGYDRNVWFDNVELAAARDVGREPVQYVANIYKYYIAYRYSIEELAKRSEARERAGIDG